ncbi:xanthine/uracil/vitamin C permease [Ligilactobacillus salitolerans]|uniref:Xanthine/uracil/vitamin C permease n=1 Tax=Ligilactobacillus salitolerans TaxID=1808352 RepID=A0A401IUV7_9LACO|nr:NCS2 family permease [Ligilactobacillus salitolerans]GBG95312.1 xanthine/uracil/vitamin C permease [Ligilactobacillus salitolerans]
MTEKKKFTGSIKLSTELIAGATSFFAIAYIIIVNPIILKDAGVPPDLSIFATIFASVLGCVLMYFLADAPIIITPGMGVNAFFTYTLVQTMKFTWQQALAVCTVSGFFYLLVALTPLSKFLANAIPASLKHGITAGIGLFLVVLGLEKARLIRSGGQRSLLAVGDLTSTPVLLALFCLVLTLVLYMRKVPGGFVIGIIATSLLAFFLGASDQGGMPNVNLASLGDFIRVGDFSQAFTVKFAIAVFSLTMILVFESMGLLQGLLTDPGSFDRAYKASALAALCSSFMGTSPTVAAAESAAGIESGGRTGISALTAGLLFLLSLFFIPFLGYVPNAAVAPVIIITGALMMEQIGQIDLTDFSEWFPAFLIIVLIPLTGSISTGLAFGFASYPLVKFAAKKTGELSWTMLILAGLFLLQLVAGALL